MSQVTHDNTAAVMQKFLTLQEGLRIKDPRQPVHGQPNPRQMPPENHHSTKISGRRGLREVVRGPLPTKIVTIQSFQGPCRCIRSRFLGGGISRDTLQFFSLGVRFIANRLQCPCMVLCPIHVCMKPRDFSRATPRRFSRWTTISRTTGTRTSKSTHPGIFFPRPKHSPPGVSTVGFSPRLSPPPLQEPFIFHPRGLRAEIERFAKDHGVDFSQGASSTREV